LMGGSLALALHGKVKALIGIDHDPATLEQAAVHFDRVAADFTLLRQADLVILATPAQVIIRLLPTIAPQLKPETLIIDLGSVKAPIIAAMRSLPPDIYAIGGHPMCGKESSGFTAAEPGLYVGCTFVLCDPGDGRAREADRSLAESLVAAIGGRALWIDPVAHDHAVAAISHVPYLLSSALMAATVQAADRDLLLTLASTGFRDTTRLAGSDPTMMGDVVAANAEAIRAAWESVRAQMDSLIEGLTAADPIIQQAARAQLADVREARRTWGESFAARR